MAWNNITWYTLEQLLKLIEEGWLPKFPHFKPIERRLATLFIQKYRIEGKYAFSVPLPTTRAKILMQKEEEWLRREAYLYCFKLDILIDCDYYYYIIEVKERIRPSALGQLAIYHDLFIREYKPNKPVYLGITYLIRDTDVETAAYARGIRLFPLGD